MEATTENDGSLRVISRRFVGIRKEIKHKFITSVRSISIIEQPGYKDIVWGSKYGNRKKNFQIATPYVVHNLESSLWTYSMPANATVEEMGKAERTFEERDSSLSVEYHIYFSSQLVDDNDKQQLVDTGLPNTYQNGKACIEYRPTNMLDFPNIFWSSNFNNDLYGISIASPLWTLIREDGNIRNRSYMLKTFSHWSNLSTEKILNLTKRAEKMYEHEEEFSRYKHENRMFYHKRKKWNFRTWREVNNGVESTIVDHADVTTANRMFDENPRQRRLSIKSSNQLTFPCKTSEDEKLLEELKDINFI